MAPPWEMRANAKIIISESNQEKVFMTIIRGKLSDMSIVARKRFQGKPLYPAPEFDVYANLEERHKGFDLSGAVRVFIAWVNKYYHSAPTLPVSVDDLQAKMGKIDVDKALRFMIVCEIFGVVPSKVDNSIRRWLGNQFNKVGITAHEIALVFDTFPLNNFPVGGSDNKRDLRGNLLQAINKWQYDNYPAPYAEKMGAMCRDRPDIKKQIKASARRYNVFRERQAKETQAEVEDQGNEGGQVEELVE